MVSKISELLQGTRTQFAKVKLFIHNRDRRPNFKDNQIYCEFSGKMKKKTFFC